MDNNQSINLASSRQKVYVKLYMFVLLAFQIIALVAFCNGIASFYGRTVNIPTAIELCFTIFDMGKAYYRSLFATATGVFYAVTLIMLVKHIITTISTIGRSLKLKKITIDPTSTPVSNVSAYTVAGFINIFTFMAFCAMVKPYNINNAAKYLIILAAFIFVFTRIFIMILNRYKIKSVLINIAYMLVFMASACLVLMNTLSPAFSDLFANSKLLFKELEFSHNVASEVCNIVQSILSIIIVFTTIGVISSTNQVSLCHGSFVSNYNAHSVLYLCIAMAISPVCGYVLEGKYITMNTILSVAVPYIQTILAAVALLLYGYFTKESDVYPLKIDETAANENQPEPEASAEQPAPDVVAEQPAPTVVVEQPAPASNVTAETAAAIAAQTAAAIAAAQTAAAIAAQTVVATTAQATPAVHPSPAVQPAPVKQPDPEAQSTPSAQHTAEEANEATPAEATIAEN